MNYLIKDFVGRWKSIQLLQWFIQIPLFSPFHLKFLNKNNRLHWNSKFSSIENLRYHLPSSEPCLASGWGMCFGFCWGRIVMFGMISFSHQFMINDCCWRWRLKVIRFLYLLWHKVFGWLIVDFTRNHRAVAKTAHPTSLKFRHKSRQTCRNISRFIILQLFRADEIACCSKHMPIAIHSYTC